MNGAKSPEPLEQPESAKFKKGVPYHDTKAKLIAALRKCFKVSAGDLEKNQPAPKGGKRPTLTKAKSSIVTIDRKSSTKLKP